MQNIARFQATEHYFMQHMKMQWYLRFFRHYSRKVLAIFPSRFVAVKYKYCSSETGQQEVKMFFQFPRFPAILNKKFKYIIDKVEY